MALKEHLIITDRCVWSGLEGTELCRKADLQEQGWEPLIYTVLRDVRIQKKKKKKNLILNFSSVSSCGRHSSGPRPAVFLVTLYLVLSGICEDNNHKGSYGSVAPLGNEHWCSSSSENKNSSILRSRSGTCAENSNTDPITQERTLIHLCLLHMANSRGWVRYCK